ncbi:MAG: CHAD domain-containing protein [bacterium]
MIVPASDKWILDVLPDYSTVDVAVRTLRDRLSAVRHYLMLAAEKEDRDGEHVHQLRVWSRRAMAALDLYQDLMPRRRRDWMRKQVRRIRRTAGDARDCDVLMQRLKRKRSTLARKRWLVSLSAERADAQQAIVAIHDRLVRDDRFARRMDALLDRVSAEAGERSERVPARFSDWARLRVPVALGELFSAVPADPTDEAALHQFRIRSKELRYAMELLVGAFPQQFRTTLYPIIESLQDRLGEINDLAIEKARLQRKIAAADGGAEVAGWRRLLAHERAQLDQARQKFWEWCTPTMLGDLRASFATLLVDSHAISASGASEHLTSRSRLQPEEASHAAVDRARRDPGRMETTALPFQRS